MGKIVEKKKKKKGRPSLLDLQKRTLKEQQQQQQQHNQSQNRNISKPNNSILNSSNNYKSATQSSSLRRSTRRNSTTPSSEEEEEEENDAVVESLNNGKKRREKKLKLVLKLPSSSTTSQKSEADSDSNGSDDDNKTTSFNRKRKITAIGDGSVSEKGDIKTVSGANPTSNIQDSGTSTPLPDKKLLSFILERLQKKDTYGVFSEPVDPEELPDYHEVIEHPMDFATVREKLTSGVYVNLEEFEKDVFLICSNAMQYNAPDTIYFRQARSIQELAKKDFENLRQDSDDNEPEPTVVRRGRPPSKNFKKPLGRPSFDRSGSEYSLGATLAAGGESTIWSNNDLRKGPLVSDKPAFADSSGRSHGCRSDANLLSDNKFERNDEATGSMLKGNSVKYGKRQYALDENKRNTYKQLSVGGQEPSVLATFDSERKQLMAVGLLSEHGYARSLARFAANVGTVVWKIASKRIERCLPPGIKFGPGWVVENDIPPQRALVLSSPPPGLQLPSQPLSLPLNAAATSSTVESKEIPLHKPENNFTENNMPPNHSASASSSTSPVAANKSEPCTERAEPVERLNSHGGNSSMIRPRPPIQIHPMHPGMNGLNGTYGFNLPMAQMGRLAGTSSRPAGFNFQSSQMVDRIVKPNTNFVHPATASLTSESPKLSAPSSTIKPGKEELEVPRSGLERRPSWQGSSTHQPKSDSGLSPQQRSDSVPPDLNVRFQSPGSPSSTRVDLTQPDLALQL